MKQRRSRLLALLLAGAVAVSSFSGIGFAEEAGTLSAEIQEEEAVWAESLSEESEEPVFEEPAGDEAVFETEDLPETDAGEDAGSDETDGSFVDGDGLIEDESPEETAVPETDPAAPETETDETEGAEDILISDEEPESGELTEEETEELTELETDILEEENLEADSVSGSWTYTTSGSSAVITGYTGTATTISIPTTVGGKTVTAIQHGAFANNTKLKAVSIPATVRTIGSATYNYTGAFEGCKNLTSVTLSAGSEMTTIGANAFKNCLSLSKIVIPGNYNEIKRSAFYGCTALQSVDYKAGAYSQAIGESAFAECANLTTVILSSSVSTIGITRLKMTRSLAA